MRSLLARRAKARAEELESQTQLPLTRVAEVIPIKAAKDRQRVVLEGVVSTLAIRPHDHSRWLDADLADSTGEVTLTWMGRREIPGITVGRRLRVEGRLTHINGRCRIYNPRYELLAD